MPHPPGISVTSGDKPAAPTVLRGRAFLLHEQIL